MVSGDNVPVVSIAPESVATAAQMDQQWVPDYVESQHWKRDWPDVKDGKVIGRLNTKQWPQIYHVSPEAVLAKAIDAQTHHLSGRKLYIGCPTLWFTDIMIQAFGGAYPPCPMKIAHAMEACNVKPHGWTKMPSRICFIDLVAYVFASSWDSHGHNFGPAAQLSQHLCVVQDVAVHRWTAWHHLRFVQCLCRAATHAACLHLQAI